MYTAVLVNLFKDVFMILGIIVVMFRLDVRLALVSLATLPLIVAITAVFRIRAREAYRETRVRLARINAYFAENIAGIRLVQIFRQERRKSREFDEVNSSHLRASMRELNVYAVFRPSMELVYSLAVAILLWFGGGQLLRGVVDFGVLYAFVNYLELFFRPINDLTEKYNIMQASMASAERIFLILDEEPAIAEIEDPRPMGEVKGHIEFKNVWFAYVGEDWVLRDVSFTVEPGQTVAFVGATGAGKTTIMNLLSRFYDIQKGQILIDGQDIKELSKGELRRNVGLVMQDVFMFSGTIAENITLNNPDIDPERVRRVAEHVNAHHFISALPKQYEEPVTERGSTLSAGQRQLLAFARALAYDPAILILDEATANIDTETEMLIQDALPKLLKGRTSLVVAHRLSTIQDADKIIVLHKGKIREQGTHQELLAQKGLYHNLFLLQYKESLTESEGAS
jgi:ATP-binding cassette subfamily B multidrug efflux pump